MEESTIKQLLKMPLKKEAVDMGNPVIQSTVSSPARRPLPDNLLEIRRCRGCGEIMFLTPVLKCEHCGEIFRLRCHSYKHGKDFYAECLTLNLLARGSTQEEAVARLQEQMFTYVEAALLGGETKGLIPRRAPFGSWVRYCVHLLRNRVKRIFVHHPHGQDLEFQDVGVSMFSHC
jgi:predicted RNase H-like HicB family nuclease